MVSVHKITNLTKTYATAKKPTLKGLNLELKNGEIFGFLGSNGAGKTTTIKCICGILPFEEGEVLINGKAPSGTYSIFNDKLLMPEFEEDKTVNIIYYTANTAISADGIEKKLMDKETDSPLIPDVFAEPIIVYGTCMRLKANPQHVKFSYWMSMYNSALASMRSRISVDANSTPFVNLRRY